jgi:hypothetical protein
MASREHLMSNERQAANAGALDGPLTKEQISTLRELLGIVADSLKKGGVPFRWGEGVRIRWTKLLGRAGVVLMTRTALARQGLEPKRGAKPVGTAYFGAPLQVQAGLYVLGVQTRPKPAAANPPLLRDGEASASANPRRRGPHGP